MDQIVSVEPRKWLNSGAGCERVSQGKERFKFFSLSTRVELL